MHGDGQTEIRSLNTSYFFFVISHYFVNISYSSFTDQPKQNFAHCKAFNDETETVRFKFQPDVSSNCCLPDI